MATGSDQLGFSGINRHFAWSDFCAEGSYCIICISHKKYP
jgi:hypothetical protein